MVLEGIDGQTDEMAGDDHTSIDSAGWKRETYDTSQAVNDSNTYLQMYADL